MLLIAAGTLTACAPESEDELGAADSAVKGNGSGDQVSVCHAPPGNPDNAHTIVVGPNAVKAHLNHGDTLGSCGGGTEPAAKIAYMSRETGVWELWVIDDDGQNPVRITDGLGTNGNTGGHVASYPVFSWDGEHVAVKDASHVYVMTADGSDLRAAVALPTYYQFGWYGDSQHILFTNSSATCNDNLQRIDALTPGASATTIYAPGGIQGHGVPNPTDDNDVLFDNQVCAQHGQLWRLDVATQTASRVPGTPSFHGRANWSSDGANFTWATGDVYVQPAAGGPPELVINAPVGGSYQSPAYGDDDQSLYVTHCTTNIAECDIVRIDIASKTATTLPLSFTVGGHRVSWARLSVDIDRDNDGLGNGIDPTPDG